MPLFVTVERLDVQSPLQVQSRADATSWASGMDLSKLSLTIPEPDLGLAGPDKGTYGMILQANGWASLLSRRWPTLHPFITLLPALTGVYSPTRRTDVCVLGRRTGSTR